MVTCVLDTLISCNPGWPKAHLEVLILLSLPPKPGIMGVWQHGCLHWFFFNAYFKSVLLEALGLEMAVPSIACVPLSSWTLQAPDVPSLDPPTPPHPHGNSLRPPLWTFIFQMANRLCIKVVCKLTSLPTLTHQCINSSTLVTWLVSGRECLHSVHCQPRFLVRVVDVCTQCPWATQMLCLLSLGFLRSQLIYQNPPRYLNKIWVRDVILAFSSVTPGRQSTSSSAETCLLCVSSSLLLLLQV